MNQFQNIETHCTTLSDARSLLRKKLEAKLKAQRELDAEFNDDLRALQSKCAALRTTIEVLVEEARPEFLKPKQPKTRVFSGITVGFEKSQDAVIYPEESTLIKNIETMLPASTAKTLLDKKTTIIKNAVKKLAKEIKQRLGIQVISGGDQVVVYTSDEDIEKLVQKSLGNAKEVQS